MSGTPTGQPHTKRARMQTANWFSDATSAVGGFLNTFTQGVKNIVKDAEMNYEVEIYDAEHPTGANKEYQQAFDATSVGREFGEAADAAKSTLEDGDLYIPGRELLSKANDLLKKINPLIITREEQPALVPLTGPDTPAQDASTSSGGFDATDVLSSVLPGADASAPPALNEAELAPFRNAKTVLELDAALAPYPHGDNATEAENARWKEIKILYSNLRYNLENPSEPASLGMNELSPDELRPFQEAKTIPELTAAMNAWVEKNKSSVGSLTYKSKLKKLQQIKAQQKARLAEGTDEGSVKMGSGDNASGSEANTSLPDPPEGYEGTTQSW